MFAFLFLVFDWTDAYEIGLVLDGSVLLSALSNLFELLSCSYSLSR